MAEAGIEGGMVAVIGLDRDAVAAVVASLDAGRRTWCVANDNAPGQVVISGTPAALAAAAEPLRAAGARRSIPLKVSGPFHSPLMAGIGAELAAEFASARLARRGPTGGQQRDRRTGARRGGDPRAAGATGAFTGGVGRRSVRRMAAEGVDTFVECGPGGALTGMVRRILPEARTLNVFDAATAAEAADALTGVRVAA